MLVHLYEEYGDRLVHRLRGMFAFAIWDGRRRRLLLARDRVGKKPLFVARRGTRLWFASELMGLLQDPELDRVPDLQSIANYLAYQYVPHPGALSPASRSCRRQRRSPWMPGARISVGTGDSITRLLRPATIVTSSRSGCAS